MLGQLHSDALGHDPDPALGRAVGDAGRQPHKAGHGRQVDNGSAARIAHGRDDVLAAEKDAGEVDLYLPVPVGQRHLGKGHEHRDPGIVHQDIEPFVSVQRGGNDLGPASLVGHVLMQRQRLAAGLTNLRGRGFRALEVHVCDDHARALAGQR